jgi:hypothetical protein
MQLQHSPRSHSDGDGGSRSAVITSASTAATAFALTATLGVVAASSGSRIHGPDVSVTTPRGNPKKEKPE